MLEPIVNTARASLILLASITQNPLPLGNFYSERAPIPTPNSLEEGGFVRAISKYPSDAHALRHRLLFDALGIPFAVEAFYTIGGRECPNAKFIFNVLDYRKDEKNKIFFTPQIYPPLSISIDNSDSIFNLPKGQHHWKYDVFSRRYLEEGPKDLTPLFEQVCTQVRK